MGSFTTIGKGHGAPCFPATERAWQAARQDEKLKELCQKIIECENEDEQKRLKAQMTVWTPRCGEFNEDHRAMKDAIFPLKRQMLDIDEKGHTEEILTLMEDRDGSKWIGLFEVIMIEESVRGGTHVLVVPPQGLSDDEVQAAFSELIHLPVDPAVKNVAGCIYMVPEDHVRYQSPKFFVAEKAEEESVSAKGKSTNTPDGSLIPNPSTLSQNYPEDYDGIPYSLIVDEMVKLHGGEPKHGSRNQFVYSIACSMRSICDSDPKWIAQVLPTFGEKREKWYATIVRACNRSMNLSMSETVEKAIKLARDRMLEDSSEEEVEGTDGSGNGTRPPVMPKKLPELIALLVSKTPKIYQEAVAHAVFPALAAHLWHTTFKYIDNVEHEATLMNVLMAGTGAGKNCIVEPINFIMKDIRHTDAFNLNREQEWKDETNTKGSNKDKKKRPEGLVIQEVDPDMTNAALVMRASEAEDHFLYTRMNEIDQFDALKTSARSDAQFQIMCLAFDPGNSYGQTRVGTQSVSKRVCIRFNWNASTTIQKGKKYFKKVLTDGPISRINFCTIPEQPIGADMPVYGVYDSEFEAALKPYIDNLKAARGLIECPEALKLAKKLKEENAEFARLSQSRTYENLSFRANVIAYLKAMVLYVANGCVWDKSIETFIRWSEQYDLWCKMHFFGEAITKANEVDDGRERKKGPRNLLELLPERFTFDDAVSVRRQQDLDSSHTKRMLYNWLNRGYIMEDPDGEEDIWVKTGGKKRKRK